MLYLEENNIIHRDLALRNLLVMRDSEGKYIVKVSDFGMSKLADNNRNNSQLIPIKWSSPEVNFEKNEMKEISYQLDLFESFTKIINSRLSNIKKSLPRVTFGLLVFACGKYSVLVASLTPN